jgi:hypothetical protein
MYILKVFSSRGERTTLLISHKTCGANDAPKPAIPVGCLATCRCTSLVIHAPQRAVMRLDALLPSGCASGFPTIEEPQLRYRLHFVTIFNLRFDTISLPPRYRDNTNVAAPCLTVIPSSWAAITAKSLPKTSMHFASPCPLRRCTRPVGLVR